MNSTTFSLDPRDRRALLPELVVEDQLHLLEGRRRFVLVDVRRIRGDARLAHAVRGHVGQHPERDVVGIHGLQLLRGHGGVQL
jgi:hypothetical protein